MILGVTKADAVQDSSFDFENSPRDGILKAYIPNFLYKPPYGYPHNKNVSLIKKLSHNGYIFSIRSSIKDRIASIPFDIKVKEEFQTDNAGNPVDLSVYEKDKKRIMHWFDNPNANEESFETILRKTVDSILEVDAGVWVKVFNRNGEFRELFAYDGSTFLKNPDIHGYMGNREDFVMPVESYFSEDEILDLNKDTFKRTEAVMNVYENVYRSNAAYFQYGWTASSMPVPFGRREVVYMMRNPRTDTIYGVSPIEVLAEIILTLVYGSTYNLDFYVNNNMPDGIIQLLDANEKQIRSFRSRFEAQFKEKDAYGSYRRKFHTYPISSKKAEFTQFQLSSEQMQILEQQKWFIKIVWACFGENGGELGFTEDSNRASEIVQSSNFKKKTITPIIRLLEYHINTQLMPEFGAPMFEFKFDDYDLEEDMKKHQLYQLQISTGLKTPEMIAEEIGIDITKLQEAKREKQEFEIAKMSALRQEPFNQPSNTPKERMEQSADKEERNQKNFILKSVEAELENDLIKHFNLLEKNILNLVESLDNNKISEIHMNVVQKGLPEEILSKIKKFFSVKQFAPLVHGMIKKQFLDGLEDAGKELDRNFLPNEKSINFLSDYTFENVKGMNDETAEKLRKELSQAIINKESVPQIKERVKNVFDVGDARIKAIARTESNRALNQGRLEGAKQSGLSLKKKWVSHIDDRTSPVCKALDGKIVELDEKFVYQNKEFDTCPGHVNCRSRVVFVQED